MTCNPDWVKIQEQLCPGQLLQDRLDLVNRVFQGKLQDLKHQILKKDIFEPIATHVLVVEFKKRVLPYVDLLLIIKKGNKIRSPD